MKNHLINFYLDWVNNYCTAQRMAEDYGFSVEFCIDLIDIGRQLHEQQCQ